MLFTFIDLLSINKRLICDSKKLATVIKMKKSTQFGTFKIERRFDKILSSNCVAYDLVIIVHISTYIIQSGTYGIII